LDQCPEEPLPSRAPLRWIRPTHCNALTARFKSLQTHRTTSSSSPSRSLNKWPSNSNHLQYIFDRPEIFNSTIDDACLINGCTAIHYCNTPTDVDLIWTFSPNLKLKDGYGFNALQCLATKGKVLAASQLAMKLSPSEYKNYVTPQVFGMMGPSSDAKKFWLAFTSNIPEKEWSSYIFAFVQIHARTNRDTKQLFASVTKCPEPRLKPIFHQAFIDSFDAKYWSDQYTIANKTLFPLPMLLVLIKTSRTDVLEHFVIPGLRQSLGGFSDERYITFIKSNTTYPDGKSWKVGLEKNVVTRIKLILFGRHHWEFYTTK